MFTSRAEFRLLLRHDNADIRLMGYGHKLGLLPTKVYQQMVDKKEKIGQLHQLISQKSLSHIIFNPYATTINSSSIKQATPIVELLRRPEVKLKDLISLAEIKNGFSEEEIIHVEFSTKYEGYLKRQNDLVHKFNQMENKLIPHNFDYSIIPGLSAESREKLLQIKPASLGQAARIAGVRQGDISILMIYLEKLGPLKKNSL
jgi:tRNA uridine 5-carboxymethylaminomethyl modification enzyme